MHPLLIKAFTSHNISLSDLEISGNIITHSPTSKKYLTRIAIGKDLDQMKGEAAGLIAMSYTSSDLAPKLLALEISEDGMEGAMVSQYWDLGGSGSKSNPEFQKELARRIATMHTSMEGSTSISGTSIEEDARYRGNYGFGVSTHCGITQLDNTWEESWEVFYRDRRLGDVIKRIDDAQINEEWEKMQEKAISLLLRDFEPKPKPVICHGDLWSGNVGIDRPSGNPVIWDPACYWGHNESDLGVMHMFGGFTQDFFDEYHRAHPRSSPHYNQRQTLYELWHHLNHTLMFGGGYRGGALRMMRTLNSWAEGQQLQDN